MIVEFHTFAICRQRYDFMRSDELPFCPFPGLKVTFGGESEYLVDEVWWVDPERKVEVYLDGWEEGIWDDNEESEMFEYFQRQGWNRFEGA